MDAQTIKEVIVKAIFISIRDFSSQTGISEESTSRGIRRGKIPSVKLGGRRLIPVSFLEDLERSALDDQGVKND